MSNTNTNSTNSTTSALKGIANNPGFQDLKSDLNTLKEDAAHTIHDAASVAKTLKNESGAIARDGIKNLKSAGTDEFHRMEARVRERPGQSVALAFCAGLVFSYVMGRR